MAQLLKEKAGMLKEYFAIDIDEVRSMWRNELLNQTDLLNCFMFLTTTALLMSIYSLDFFFFFFVCQHANLRTLPLLLDQYTPDLTRLPMFVLRMATEVSGCVCVFVCV